MYLGSELLATGELDAYANVKADVLLSMALAKCNMARDEFAAGKQVRSESRQVGGGAFFSQPSRWHAQ
jgi:hypothetical protein